QALRALLGYDLNDEEANFLLERVLSARGEWEAIVDLHERRAQTPGADRAGLYRRFASVWGLRWNDAARSAAFYGKALEAYYQNGVEQFPGHVAAFEFLRDVHAQSGDWEPLLELAELGLRAQIDDADKAILAAQAGAVAWKGMGDTAKAKIYFAQAK